MREPGNGGRQALISRPIVSGNDVPNDVGSSGRAEPSDDVGVVPSRAEPDDGLGIPSGTEFLGGYPTVRR